MGDVMRTAWAIVLAEMEGREFDMNTMDFKPIE